MGNCENEEEVSALGGARHAGPQPGEQPHDISSSRTVLRMCARGVLAERIDEFMKTVDHALPPKDPDIFVPLIKLRFLHL